MSLRNSTKSVIAFTILFLLSLPSSNAQSQGSYTGTIALPAGVISDGNISIESNLVAFPFAGTDSSVNPVPVGSSDVSYSLSPSDPLNVEEVIISFSCTGNCLAVDGALRTIFYLQDDGTFDYIINSVPVSDVPTPLDFQFPEPPEIETLTGTIHLPTGVTSNGSISVISDINVYDENGNSIPDIVFNSNPISLGNSNTSYLMRYRELAENYEVAIYFSCFLSTRCARATNTLNDFFYLQDDGSFSTEFNTIPSSGMPNTLDFQFAPVNTLYGIISLPPGIVSDGDIISIVQVSEYDSGGNLVDGAFIRETVPLGSSQKPYSFGYFEPKPNNEIAISFGCDRCIEVEGEESVTYYLQDDGSFAPAFNTIPVSDVPSSLDFQFPAEMFPIQSLPSIILLLLS